MSVENTNEYNEVDVQGDIDLWKGNLSVRPELFHSPENSLSVANAAARMIVDQLESGLSEELFSHDDDVKDLSDFIPDTPENAANTNRQRGFARSFLAPSFSSINNSTEFKDGAMHAKKSKCSEKKSQPKSFESRLKASSILSSSELIPYPVLCSEMHSVEKNYPNCDESNRSQLLPSDLSSDNQIFTSSLLPQISPPRVSKRSTSETFPSAKRKDNKETPKKVENSTDSSADRTKNVARLKRESKCKEILNSFRSKPVVLKSDTINSFNLESDEDLLSILTELKADSPSNGISISNKSKIVNSYPKKIDNPQVDSLQSQNILHEKVNASCTIDEFSCESALVSENEKENMNSMIEEFTCELAVVTESEKENIICNNESLVFESDSLLKNVGKNAAKFISEIMEVEEPSNVSINHTDLSQTFQLFSPFKRSEK